MIGRTVFPLLVLAALVLASCSGHELFQSQPAGASFVPAARPLSYSRGKIKHIVFIVQENRSFDNFFDCFPGTDCVKSAPGPGPRPNPVTTMSPCPVLPTASPGPTPSPIQIAFGVALPAYDPDHTYCPAFVTEYDGGKLDGFYWDDGVYYNQPAGTYPYQVVAKSQIRPYWDLATQYVLADRTFPTQASGSFTAHQDLIRGNAQIRTNASAVDYPWNHSFIENWGCDDAPPSQGGPSYTPLITTTHKYIMTGPFPCFTYPTIRDLLDAKRITWKYYAPIFPFDGGQLWNAFDAILAVRDDPSEWPPSTAKWTCSNSCVTWPETNVLCDAAGSTASPCPAPSPKSGGVRLPAVSWVIPDSEDSDHYDGLGTDNGPDWVTAVVNKIGKSANWNSTVIVILWDDWGGFYDHVPPPQLDYTGLGFRVPMIIVSPYAKKGYVAHTQYEFGSLLKFVEETFGLPSLGTTDERANNINDAFNFKQTPRAFVPIRPLDSKHNATYFLHRPESKTPVDTD